jgi:ATP-dependent protease ClpP protease subunit
LPVYVEETTVEEVKTQDFKDDPKQDDLDTLHQLGHFSLVGSMEEGNCRDLGLAIIRRARVYEQSKVLGPPPTFTLTISSGGGIADALFTLGGILLQVRRMGIRVTTHITHEACSAAALLTQYGNLRTAEAYAEIMLHDFKWWAYGKRFDHEQNLVRVNRERLKYATVLAQRNTAGYNNPQYWLEKYLDRDDHYLSAQEALQLGLLDVVFESPITLCENPNNSLLVPA